MTLYDELDEALVMSLQTTLDSYQGDYKRAINDLCVWHKELAEYMALLPIIEILYGGNENDVTILKIMDYIDQNFQI